MKSLHCNSYALIGILRSHLRRVGKVVRGALPNIVSNQLDKIGVACRGLCNLGKNLGRQRHARRLKAIPQRKRYLFFANGPEVFSERTPEESQRITINKLGNPHGQARKNEGDVLPLPDKMLNGMRHLLHIFNRRVLHLVYRNQQTRCGSGAHPHQVAQAPLVLLKRKRASDRGKCQSERTRLHMLRRRELVNEVGKEARSRGDVHDLPSELSGTLAKVVEKHRFARSAGTADTHKPTGRPATIVKALFKRKNHIVSPNQDGGLGAGGWLKGISHSTTPQQTEAELAGTFLFLK